MMDVPFVSREEFDRRLGQPAEPGYRHTMVCGPIEEGGPIGRIFTRWPGECLAVHIVGRSETWRPTTSSQYREIAGTYWLLTRTKK